MKKVITVLVAALLALPISAVVTFLLTPLWRWLEATTGIESIGHSGPADWCFVAVYFTALAALGGFFVWIQSRSRDTARR